MFLFLIFYCKLIANLRNFLLQCSLAIVNLKIMDLLPFSGKKSLPNIAKDNKLVGNVVEVIEDLQCFFF